MYRKSVINTLHYIYLTTLLLIIDGILTTAMYMQYMMGEIPCPLCLLQRLVLFLIAFIIISICQNGYSLRKSGFLILFTLYLLIISLRQSLLDIVQRFRHEWIGSTLWGIHLPVWSFIASLMIILSYSMKFILISPNKLSSLKEKTPYRWLSNSIRFISLYTFILLIINFISIILQCGFFHICHTTSYFLL